MYSPVANRMGVTQYAVLEHMSVVRNKALRIQCAAHIVGIGFPCVV